MYNSKVKMPKELKKKCHAVIHSATAAATAAGATPIPISDTVAITSVQIAMIIGLGKAFDITLSQAAAKTLATVTITQQTGRAIFTAILKSIPGPTTLVGAFVAAVTAASLTEALGWMIADDFYRLSQGQEPENIVETAGELRTVFDGLKIRKK